MKCFLVLLTSLFFSIVIKAQGAEDSVKLVVNNLFTAMRTADGTLLKSTFSDSAVLQTISHNKEGSVVVVTESVSEFAVFVNTLKKDSADERIQFETIKIDPSPEMRKELAEWIKYCGSLNKHVIEAVSPGTSGKGPGDYEISDIMKYQKISSEDMNEALKELE